ncbi:hypothetical protein, partial [Frigidibacter oleivorans]|uniref:hypothetical protein n=1 Tax=Frigidibacter oleivorans TaxID=2487129 RepID=UPI00197A73D8
MELTWTPGTPPAGAVPPVLHAWRDWQAAGAAPHPDGSRRAGLVDLAARLEARLDALADRLTGEGEGADPFAGLAATLAGMAGLPGQDRLNPHPGSYRAGDETRPGGDFLDAAALPDDPARLSVLGVIDDAIPFAHRLFRCGPQAQASRCAAVWLQDAWPGPAAQAPGGDLPFGREWRGSGIGAMLDRLGSAAIPDEETLYRRTGALDFARDVVPSAAYAQGHGAAVAGLAAGHDPGDPLAERAGRDHPLIAVSLPAEVTRDTMGSLAPPFLMLGILFILHRARRLARRVEALRGLPQGSLRPPVTLVIAYGVTAGPRDGSDPLSRLIDALSGTRLPGLGQVRFVLPAGNHRMARLHAELAPGAPVDWLVAPDDRTPSAVEFWGPVRPAPPPQPAQLTLRCAGLAAPVTTGFAAAGDWQRLTDGAGRETARAYHRLLRSRGGWREGIVLVLPPTAPMAPGLPQAQAGRWTLAVSDADGGAWQASVQRDDAVQGFRRAGHQGRFDDPAFRHWLPDGHVAGFDPVPPAGPVRRQGTLNAFACGEAPLRVGGAFGDGGDLPYAGLLPGQGDPRCGDLRAVCEAGHAARGIAAPASRSGGAARLTGTSVAAPQVARWLAQRLADGAALP